MGFIRTGSEPNLGFERTGFKRTLCCIFSIQYIFFRCGSNLPICFHRSDCTTRWVLEQFLNRKTERQKDRKTERQKDRKTERQKDRKTERQKDRKTERQKDRKTEQFCLIFFPNVFISYWNETFHTFWVWNTETLMINQTAKCKWCNEVTWMRTGGGGDKLWKIVT